MIKLWTDHPRVGGAIAGMALTASAAMALYLVRRTPSGSSGPEAMAPTAPMTMDPHTGHGAASSPEGFAPVMIEPAQAEAMGLTTEAVAERDFTRHVRTVGVVTVDETRTEHVHTRVRGWIETFDVKFVGKKVRAGQTLASLYSQDVYAAEMELASLARNPGRSPELLQAARQRLDLWDVPANVIDQVEKTGAPQRTFPIRAPRSGVVVAKQAFEGQFVDPSLELYTISDLSTVWVLADIYDKDVEDVRVGSLARLTIEGQHQPIEAKVAFLYPTIDERTRTRKARFELSDRDAELLPGAFVTIEIDAALDRGLAVPESAVIRTGARSIVFVVHGAHVQPLEVQLGPLVGDFHRVESGLTAGDLVATGAQFLLDSESRLRATSAPGGGHAGHAGH